ncbi:TonB-dependent receptor [Cytophagaceae bacterium DM2B3-1]|uniref:TonB-dependent receptor n=1 Tax=Xanthocytophaga flava TaxID=3048013 RepID=A0ABT7CGC1_9BACT|nr:TonB-dependent receptor [Xanthocytophaga flavus]MDJ1472010.1 TonB-dependent receptor [Xanthocytophaga flavus]MDJ1492794.1 TonB-dependent receptor [Xanthocytophaga flavus]
MKHPFRIRQCLACLSFILTICCIQISPATVKMAMLQKKIKKMVIPEGTLAHALDIIEDKAAVNLAYDENAILTYHVPKATFNETTVGDVLTNMLQKFPQLRFEEKYNTIVIFPNTTYAETSTKDITVTGTVKDDQNQPLAGVTVIVKGTNIGSITNADGKYTISVPSQDATLVFSFIGYVSEEVAVGTRTSVDITLVNDVKSLMEVVVVGYGTQRKNEVTGAVSSISTKEVSSRNYNSAAEVLQGTVPGVTIMNNGGDPTAQPSINIRGIGSINGESPLIIVDGSIYMGSFNSINPNDIESLSILKDASAAIYGARASGGVVLITTKKGLSNKTNVNVNYQQGFQQAGKKLEALNAAERADIVNMIRKNEGLSEDPAFTTFPDARITKTNWMDEIFQTGRIYNINASLSGGNEKSTFFLSGGYRKNEGILLNTYSDRFTARLNSSHHLHKKVKVGENLSYSLNNGQGANTFDSYVGPIIGSIYYPPNATVYREDGSGLFGGVPEQYPASYGDVVNPVAYLKRLDNKNPVSNLLINPYLEWEIISGLKFRSNWAYTRINDDTKRFTSRVLETGKIFDFNELYQSHRLFQSLLNEQTLQWEQTLNQLHKINILVGHTYEHWKNESYSVTGTGFDNEAPFRRYLTNAKSISAYNSDAYETNQESYLGRLNYSFADKYLLTGILRRDGTSKLTGKNAWKWYPSVSAGWVISQEPFMQNISLISTLKLRASWGKIGNLGQLGPYAFSVPFDKLQTMMGLTPSLQLGFAENERSNPDLVWEGSEQKNAGLDFGFLNDQFTGSVDFFIKNNKNMLLRKTFPGVAGTPKGKIINAGNMENRGVEIGLTYHKSKGELQFDISANAAYTKNTLKALYEDVTSIPMGPTVRQLPLSNIARIGDPFNAFYGYKTAGLFQSNDEAASYVNGKGERLLPNAQGGDLKFVDSNNDGVINDKDRVILGSIFPKWTYSLNGNFRFKNFDLNLFFQGVQGNKILNAVKFTGLNANFFSYNFLSDIKNAWTPENTNTDVPRLTIKDPNNNFSRVSNFYVENGSYLRLKSLTLGYSLPDTWVKGLHSRIYFTGQNLFTITKYSGMDPEVGMNNSGIDVGLYPVSRVYMFGIDVNF